MFKPTYIAELLVKSWDYVDQETASTYHFSDMFEDLGVEDKTGHLLTTCVEADYLYAQYSILGNLQRSRINSLKEQGRYGFMLLVFSSIDRLVNKDRRRA